MPRLPTNTPLKSEQFSIQSWRAMQRRWRIYPLLGAGLVAGVVLVMSLLIERSEEQREIDRLRSEITTQASQLRARIEHEINAPLHLSFGLSTFISGNPEFTEEQFARMTQQMLRVNNHVRHIVAAPDNVVRYVVPFKGNEKALGLAYMHHPEQRDSVLQIMRTAKPMVAGPVNLVQGGQAFINRVPIFISNEDHPRYGEYWGLLSVVMNSTTLLHATGIDKPYPGLEIGLRGRDGLGAQGGMIYGKAEVFEHRPVLLEVNLPGGSTWQLGLAPQQGWHHAVWADSNLLRYRVLGISLAVMVGIMAFLWLTHLRRLREQDDKLQLLACAFEHSAEAIFISDAENRIIAANPAFTRLTGYALPEILGQNPSVLSAGQTPSSVYEAMWYGLEQAGHWQGEIWDKRSNGEVYPKWLNISVMRNAKHEVIYYIASFTDITDQKRNEEKIRHLAHHDFLTGLPNRFTLHQRMADDIKQAKQERMMLAVLFIDLDRFKPINDTYGHEVGDKLLIEVANRLKETVRRNDVVARLGGDEFVVELLQLGHVNEAAAVAEKILHRLGAAYHIDGHELYTTPSIGISLFPTDADQAETLLKQADTAMYHAKAQGRNVYRFFNHDMHPISELEDF